MKCPFASSSLLFLLLLLRLHDLGSVGIPLASKGRRPKHPPFLSTPADRLFTLRQVSAGAVSPRGRSGVTERTFFELFSLGRASSLCSSGDGARQPFPPSLFISHLLPLQCIVAQEEEEEEEIRFSPGGRERAALSLPHREFDARAGCKSPIALGKKVA